MGCCGKKKDEDAKPKSLSKRSCTDILCCAIFLLFLGVLLFIFGLCIYAGDYTALVYDADYTGARCGVGAREGKPKAFYPRLARDMYEQRELVETGDYWNLKFYTLCVEECPTTFNLDNPESSMITDYGFDTSTALTQSFLPYTQDKWLSPTPTVDIANRCVPMTKSDQSEEKMCAYPKCDSAEAMAVGAVCANTTDFNQGEWQMCSGEVGSGEAGSGGPAASCDAQKLLCQVQATFTATMTYELATNDEESAAVLGSVAAVVGGMFEMMSSIYSAFTFIIIGGVILPVLLAFVYMLVLFLFAKMIIYTLLILLIIVELVATFVCFARSGISFQQVSGADLIAMSEDAANVTIPNSALSALGVVEEDSQMLYSIGFVVLAVVTVITVITVITGRKKIAICAAIVKEATTVFSSQPLLMFFPSLSVCAQIGVCTWFVLTLILLQTTKPESLDVALSKVINTSLVEAAGEVAAEQNVDPIGGVRDLVSSPSYITGATVLAIYGFFVLVQFVQGIAWCAMSGTTYYWYFFRNTDDENEKTKWPIFRSLSRVLFYHSGSVAFAAFVIAMCDMARVVVEYIEKQMGAAQNQLVKLCFMIVRCCLGCIKKTVKFVSYYGLVFVSCQGNSFCVACYKTFFFFLQNPGQVSINALVSWLLKIVALLTMPLFCAMVFYYLLTDSNTLDSVQNPIYPAVIIFVLAAVMTQSCMVVFECVVTTIFVCCFQDKAEFDSKHMSPQLAAAFGFKKGKEDDKAKDDKKEGKSKEGEPTLTKEGEADTLQSL